MQYYLLSTYDPAWPSSESDETRSDRGDVAKTWRSAVSLFAVLSTLALVAGSSWEFSLGSDPA
ncbi:hypothetical protein ASPZODRAFT_134233 [Penicilliopsis zonata CBS 506.65]|uniref:Uncharacterized protein n=1 Tax=Penicilliopsis zonata CBS 506.65 TaxID=1073090 RepID=A0A1L9SCH2_9EURO|nr:hypothetical protein ASPZODRAFT_134233 [Penicilliopsis zonata CBS 506.65]OJJ44843.1 hypothetical protein ASPZODRAFT_134233 [Penicilliopsis zonata CBS 506.65]